MKNQKMNFHLTKKSTNKKTGPIPVSTSDERTCPNSCPWLNRGCYASFGPLRLHWKKVSHNDRGSDFSRFLLQIRSLPRGQLWRHNQAGDLPGSENRINKSNLGRLTLSASHTRGFTYTHKPVEGRSETAKRNRKAIKDANSASFTINLSGNGIEHADKLVKLKIAPVTTILPSDIRVRSFMSPGGNKVVVCPATTEEDVTCDTCELCAIPNRKSIIGFPAHGAGKKTIDQRL